MKIQNILFTGLFLFSIPAYSQVSDTQLGSVVAMERTYQMSLQSLQANLKLDPLTKSWDSEVGVANFTKDVISILTPLDYYATVDSLSVVIIVLPHAYKARVSSLRLAPTQEQAEKALAGAFNQLHLHNKDNTIRFLKIDR